MLEFVAFNSNGIYNPFTSPPPGTWGFLRPTADIARIDFNNAFMGARDLQYIGPAFGDVGAVPEPATWMMAIAGFGLIGGVLRRQKARLSVSASRPN